MSNQKHPDKPRQRKLLRDQERACLAYAKVEQVDAEDREDYRIRVQALANDLRRMGLAAALSQLERQKCHAAVVLLRHLAEADIVGLGKDPGRLPRQARELSDLSKYMLATRELLRLIAWFTRAVQATFPESSHA